MFQQGEDPIECINKAMAFLSVVASRFPPLNNQLRTSSNPRNQATIQDGRVTVQQIQERQNQSYAGTGNRGIATTSKGNVAAGQPRVVNCYNCQGEGHMARQCTHPKRPRNGAWFKEKLMLAEAQEAGQILDEEQLAFLADSDAYDSDCDNLSSAKPVSMANLSSYDPKVLLDVPYSDSYPNDMISQDVQEMRYYEQTHVDDFQDNEIHSDTGESAISTTPGATATRTVETSIVRGLKYSSNKGWNKISQSSLFGRLQGASGEWNCGTLLCLDEISTGWHLHQTVAKRKIQLFDRKAGYEKHVSGNAKKSDRGGRRVMMYSIKKVQRTDSYEFLLANKKCTINAEVFRTIFDICPRVEGVDFTDVLDDDTALTFLIDLGYKGPLYKKKNVDDSHETIDVSEESEPEQEPARKKTSSKRRVKKKVTLSADENIISDDPDVALELVKSINHTKAEEAEAARHVHATHARIVTESAKKNSDGRSSKKEQEAANIMQALKESKKTSRRQPGVFDEEKDITKENVILEWGDEQDSKYFDDDNDDVKKDGKDGDADDEGDDYITDTQDADDEDVKTESDEDDIYSCHTCLRISFNSYCNNSTSSTCIHHTSCTSTILIPTQPIITNAPTITNVVLESNALTAIELRVAKLEKDVSELKTVNHSTKALAILKSQVPSIIDNYLGSKVGDVFQKELKKHTTDLLQKYSLQQFSESSEKQTSTFDLEQGFEKSASKILQIKREQAEKQQNPKFTIKSTDMAALEEYDLKSTLYQSMHANKYFNKNPANHQLYHALMKALIEDVNVIDKGVTDIVKDHKRKHDDDEDDDDEDPPAGPNQGKALTKGSKTDKTASAKEPVEEPIVEVVMDDAGDDVARDDNQPQDTLEPKTRKTLNPNWFKQPLRPHTPDHEWNKHQVVLDQPEQP
nr:hypothetical protein [Tanacetum cinerariifolium]